MFDKSSYDFAYDSKSDSVAGENRPSAGYFKKTPLWEPFWKIYGFGALKRSLRVHVDGRLKRKQNHRFQKYMDTC